MQVDVFHSVYHNEPMNFLKNRTISDSRDKLLPVYNTASSGLKKMLVLMILYTHKSVSVNVCPVIFLDTIFFDNFQYCGEEGPEFHENNQRRVNNPSLSRNIGKYHLPHIWDDVLFNTSEVKLK